MPTNIVHLNKSSIPEAETTLLECGSIKASTFRYESGVAGVRVKTKQVELELLPFQGQQIWRAAALGRELTMESVCRMPRHGVPFLSTFGGFLQHCGILAMGAPGPEDSHPLHGELPNAPFDRAWLVSGEDQKGAFVGLSGFYENSAVFGCNYRVTPEVRVYENSSVFEVKLKIENLNHVPMDFMYMAHINFRTVSGGRLAYSAPATPKHVRVRASIPTHIKPRPGYSEFLSDLQSNPEKHHVITDSLPADPEIVLCMDYLADDQGWAHSLHVLPDGSADFVAHKPSQLPRATRWISRTLDHNALALVEPGTAEPEGFTKEKAKGNIKTISPQGSFVCELMIGAINREHAHTVEEKIRAIVSK